MSHDNENKKCRCKEMSCDSTVCKRNHTHKRFFCDICEPETVSKMYPVEELSTPPSEVSTFHEQFEKKFTEFLGEIIIKKGNYYVSQNLADVYFDCGFKTNEFFREEAKIETVQDILSLNKWSDTIYIGDIKHYAEKMGINLSDNKN